MQILVLLNTQRVITLTQFLLTKQVVPLTYKEVGSIERQWEKKAKLRGEAFLTIKEDDVASYKEERDLFIPNRLEVRLGSY